MNRRVTPRQAANWVEEGSGAPFFGIPRLVPPITFRKRLRGALSRSRARGRRAHTRQHAPPTPALQRRHHAQAPAEDDPQRSHTGSGAHAPAASCPRARRAGQPSIASRKKALSGDTEFKRNRRAGVEGAAWCVRRTSEIGFKV